MAIKQPIWTNPALNRLPEITEELHQNIRRIAVRIVRHEGGESVDSRHVNLASDFLKRVGLSLRPWHERPELEVGMGAAVFSLGLSMPDLSAVIGYPLSLDANNLPVLSSVLTLTRLEMVLGNFPTTTRLNVSNNWSEKTRIQLVFIGNSNQQTQ